IGNTLQILSQAFTEPDETTVIDWDAEEGSRAATSASTHPKAARGFQLQPEDIVVRPTYKILLIVVVAITIFCLLADLVLAFAWPNPNRCQEQAFTAIDLGWKAGLGCLIGLLSGKQI